MSEWLKSEVEILKKTYAFTLNVELAETLKRSRASIMWKAKDIGLVKNSQHRKKTASINAAMATKVNRVHFFNEHYFDQIDTPEKAYWLGFIQADGCLIYSKEKKRIICLSIGIQEKDRFLLENFVKDVGGDACNIKTYKGKNPNAQKIVSITLRSIYLIKALLNAGISPRKSFKNGGAIVKDGELFRHYVRGIFDGDGSVGTYKKYLRMRIIGAESLCNELLVAVRESVGIICGGVSRCHPGSNTFVLAFQTKAQCLTIADWMYYDATRYLQRKKDEFYILKEGGSIC